MLSMELGIAAASATEGISLGLTDTEENQIVVFMQTLSDGYTTPYPFIGTYTGARMSGGTAATQGNSTLIFAQVLRRLAVQP
jgi:hypothetical protein